MEILIGVAVVVAALSIIIFLTIWSRNRINQLSEKGYPSARDFERNNTRER